MKPLFRTLAVIVVLTGLGYLAVGARQSPPAFFRTIDQQGATHYRNGDFREAAEVFQDPLWQGTAWYRAGEFKKAAVAFSRRDTPEAHYNRGNALLMHGDYTGAVASYDRTLEKQPDWKQARENRDLAMARGERTQAEGGDMGDQQLGADDVVFNPDAKNEGGQDTQIAEGGGVSEQDVQALWLRRVQTRPAEFLKAKFAYQQALTPKDGS